MCSIETINWVQEVHEYWAVNENGETTELQDSADFEFLRYTCMNDMEMFDTWDEVLEHIKENQDETSTSAVRS